MDNEGLRARAATQCGAFTVAQACELGWSKAQVEAAFRTGVWLRLERGTYVEASAWACLDARAQHLCRVSARLLRHPPGWRAARRSAAVAYGLPLLGVLPAVPQLVRQPQRPTDRAHSRHERLASLPEPDTAIIDGWVPVTSLARTVIDLARSESFRSGVVVADAALRRGLSAAALLSTAHRCAAWPYGLRGLRVARFANGLAENPLESISRVAMHLCRLPEPELQVDIFCEDRLVARVDTLWRAARVVGEADGRLKYTDSDVLYREKIREQDLRDLGFEVVRWSWDDAWHPGGRFEQQIRRALDRGRLNTLDPRVRIVATTVPTSAGLRIAS